jgi:hypothetical protein
MFDKELPKLCVFFYLRMTVGQQRDKQQVVLAEKGISVDLALAQL